MTVDRIVKKNGNSGRFKKNLQNQRKTSEKPMSKNKKTDSAPQNDSARKKNGAKKHQEDADSPKSGGVVAGMVRTLLILGMVAFLLWSLAKDNPKFRALFNRFVEAQNPAGGMVETLFTQGETMGTFWNVKVAGPPEGWNGARLNEAAQETLDRVDALMSTYQENSEIARFNRSDSTDWFDVSAETAKVVALALEISKETDGAFDVTVAPLVNIWKFGPDKTPLTALPTSAEIEKARSRCGWQNLEVRTENGPALRKAIPELSIDLSAIAKGYAVDALAELFATEGIANYLIDVGGEVRCAGRKAPLAPGEPEDANRWILGIEKPIVSADAPPVPLWAVTPGDSAMATSGSARNFSTVGGQRFSHIIDPRTGRPTKIHGAQTARPATEPGSVSVLDASCARADALATALFVLGPDAGIERADRLGLAVLYILRSTDAAEMQYTEKGSQKFAELKSQRLDQKVSEKSEK